MFKHKHSMVVKTITITEEAYNKMKGLKKEDESFSELFIRIVNRQKVNLREYLGVVKISDKALKEWKEEFKKDKKALRETSKRRMKELEKRIKELEK